MLLSFITIRVCLIEPNSASGNMSTLSTNDQVVLRTGLWQSKSQLIINYDVVYFRLLCKEYLTLA